MSRLSRGTTGLGSFSRPGITQASVADRQGNKSFEELKRLIHGKLVDKYLAQLDGVTKT